MVHGKVSYGAVFTYVAYHFYGGVGEGAVDALCVQFERITNLYHC